MAAGRGATGTTSPDTGGQNAGSSHGLTDSQLEAARIFARANSPSVWLDYLGDLAPNTANLAGGPRSGGKVRRSGRGGNTSPLRRDPSRVVRPGAAEARGRTRKKLEAGRRTRIAAGTCPRLAAWLHRVARCHAHLCAIVRLYGSPDKAGGQSLQGETYAGRAARGDRTLLYDCLTVTVDELLAVREEIQAVIDSAEPTAAQPGSKAKVDEMARRAERGESLFIEGDGPRPGDGSPGG
jgi:hypothetical protein